MEEHKHTPISPYRVTPTESKETFVFESEHENFSEEWCKDFISFAEKLTSEFTKRSVRLLTSTNATEAINAAASINEILPYMISFKAGMPDITMALSRNFPTKIDLFSLEFLK
jgi:hypothetical protein